MHRKHIKLKSFDYEENADDTLLGQSALQCFDVSGLRVNMLLMRCRSAASNIYTLSNFQTVKEIHSRPNLASISLHYDGLHLYSLSLVLPGHGVRPPEA